MTKRFDRYTISIADLAPGTEAIIVDLGAIPETRRDQLMAYGIAPGRSIMVLQQNPATILQVDQTELAIENQVAQQILVETPHPHGGRSRGRHSRRWHRRRRHFRFLRKREHREKD